MIHQTITSIAVLVLCMDSVVVVPDADDGNFVDQSGFQVQTICIVICNDIHDTT